MIYSEVKYYPKTRINPDYLYLTLVVENPERVEFRQYFFVLLIGQNINTGKHLRRQILDYSSGI